MWVASKVGNLHSEFGDARPLGSRVTRYVRDGRTDKSNAYRSLPYGRGHNKHSPCCLKCKMSFRLTEVTGWSFRTTADLNALLKFGLKLDFCRAYHLHMLDFVGMCCM